MDCGLLLRTTASRRNRRRWGRPNRPSRRPVPSTLGRRCEGRPSPRCRRRYCSREAEQSFRRRWGRAFHRVRSFRPRRHPIVRPRTGRSDYLDSFAGDYYLPEEPDKPVATVFRTRKSEKEWLIKEEKVFWTDEKKT